MARILSGTSWGCCSTDIFPKSSLITATVAVTGFGGFSKSVTYTTPYFGGTGYNNNTNTLAVKDASSNLVARAGLTYWGGLDSISYGSSGGTSAFGYDTYLHLNSIDSPGTLCDGSYTYDRTGNVTTRDGTNYTYDGINRLLNGAGTSYGYDEIGNITASTGTDPVSFTYASTGGLDSMLMRSITRSGTQSVSDDAKRGWITGIDTRYSNLKWDVFGRLEAIVDLARGQSGTQQDIYRYYPDGLRYRKDETAITGAVTTSLYLYEGNDILLKEMLEGTTWKTAQVNVRLGGLEIGRYVKDYVGGTERLEYVWLDTLGSRRAVTDTAGSIKAKIDYSVWGTPTVTNYNGYDGSLDVSYTGKERDATGLSYFNARYYDPLAGRFYSEDPIKDGMNWFVYCGNNPLSFTDPTGLASNVYDKYKAFFTNEERRQLSDNGMSAFRVATLSKYALDKAYDVGAREGWNSGEGWQGRIDAFRHVFWNSILAQEYGVDDASSITALHEQEHPNGGLESNMDANNNAFGISIIANNPNIQEEDLISLIVEEIDKGQGVVYFADWQKGKDATLLVNGEQEIQ